MLLKCNYRLGVHLSVVPRLIHVYFLTFRNKSSYHVPSYTPTNWINQLARIKALFYSSKNEFHFPRILSPAVARGISIPLAVNNLCRHSVSLAGGLNQTGPLHDRRLTALTSTVKPSYLLVNHVRVSVSAAFRQSPAGEIRFSNWQSSIWNSSRGANCSTSDQVRGATYRQIFVAKLLSHRHHHYSALS